MQDFNFRIVLGLKMACHKNETTPTPAPIQQKDPEPEAEPEKSSEKQMASFRFAGIENCSRGEEGQEPNG